MLAPSAAWRDRTTLAAAERLIKSKQHLADSMLGELKRGRDTAGNIGMRFTQLNGIAQRCANEIVW
jgi:hypothetical protein